jgi:hypothetical protein
MRGKKMATYKVTTRYEVTEYVDAPKDVSLDVVAIEAHGRYVAWDDLKQIDYTIEEMVKA